MGIIVNKQAKGKILSERTNVWTEPFKHSQSWDSFFQWVTEENEKKEETIEKDTCVHLDHQRKPPREARVMKTNGQEPELLVPFPFESMAYWTKRSKGPGLQKTKQNNNTTQKQPQQKWPE